MGPDSRIHYPERETCDDAKGGTVNYPPTGQEPTGHESSAHDPDDWQPYGQDAAYSGPYPLPPVGYQSPPPDYLSGGYYPPADYYNAGYYNAGYLNVDYYAAAGYPPMYSNPYPGGYGNPGLYQAPSNSGKAVTSLVCGVISICTSFLCCAFGLPFAITAIAVGVGARREIADSAGRERGDGMAIAGIFTGIVGVLLSVMWIALMLLV